MMAVSPWTYLSLNNSYPCKIFCKLCSPFICVMNSSMVVDCRVRRQPHDLIAPDVSARIVEKRSVVLPQLLQIENLSTLPLLSAQAPEREEISAIHFSRVRGFCGATAGSST